MEHAQRVSHIPPIEELKEIVAEVLEVEIDEITETSLFKEDHEADSLRAVEILARIEKKYNVDIPQEQLAQITHLQALYEVVKAAVERNEEMTKRRVVITGLGVVSNIGLGVSAFTEALKAGKCGTSPIRSFDASGFPHRMGGEIHDFDPTHWLKRLIPTSYARTCQFAAAAARMAAEDAGVEQLADTNCGVSVGTTNGNNDLIERLTEERLKQGSVALAPSLIRQIPASRLATAVNDELDLMGETITISSACAAGNYAIGYAYDLIQAGMTDYMLCGGADGTVPRWVHAGFYRLGAISPSVCKPFDKQRQGILIGEGAGMLFLETLESAQRRGARIYAEVMGYGLNCDATHITAPDHVSVVECMHRAYTNAGIKPQDIDYICAHGTGTKVNDAMECRAIQEVFGSHKPAVSSIKSMIGHTMGAASALGAVACALAIYHRFIPPTINFKEKDPECDIDCVANHAREATLNIVQNNGFAFGGNNAIMILASVPLNGSRKDIGSRWLKDEKVHTPNPVAAQFIVAGENALGRE